MLTATRNRAFPGRRPLSAAPLLVVALTALLAAALGCDDLGPAGPVETRDDSFSVSGSVTVDVDSFNGDVRVIGSDGNTVRVRATLKGADRIDYSARQFGSSVQVSASRTGSSITRSPSVELEITAPSSADLLIQTSNGEIAISDFDAGATLLTSNGRIRVTGMNGLLETRTSNGTIDVTGFVGQASAETSNGSITVEGEFPPGTDNELITSNGSITLDLEPNPSLEVDASTSNGTVSTAFQVLTRSVDSKRLEGTIGDGEASLFARTSNGSIRIR